MVIDIELLKKTMKKIPFFSGISDEECDKILPYTLYNFYKEDSLIYNEFSKVDHNFFSEYFLIIVSGSVKVLKIKEDGQEFLHEFLTSGHYFGDLQLINPNSFKCTLIANEDCEIVFIPGSLFKEKCLNNQSNLKILMEIYHKKVIEWYNKSILLLNVKSLSIDKTRNVLKDLSEKNGVPYLENSILITLKITHKDISQLGYMSRETVTRNLSILEKNEEIEILKRRFILKQKFFKNLLKG